MKTIRFMNGLEVEPARDAGIDIDHHVFGHRVAVRQSEAMQAGERDDRPLDDALPHRFRNPRVFQQARQRVARQPWQQRGIRGVNGSAVKKLIDAALTFHPFATRQHPHAGVEQLHQAGAHPDEERRIERATLSHLTLAAVLADDPGLRVSPGPKQLAESQTGAEVGALNQIPHDAQFLNRLAGV